MKKTALYLLLMVSLLLSACTDSSTTATVPASSDTPKPDTSVPPTQGSQKLSECTVIAQEPTPGPTAESLFPPVTENDWVRGPADAQVTIVVYSDFQ